MAPKPRSSLFTTNLRMIQPLDKDSSGNLDHRRASSFAWPSLAKKLLTTLGLNSETDPRVRRNTARTGHKCALFGLHW